MKTRSFSLVKSTSVIILTLFIASCTKTVSPRKLDGTWIVITGEASSEFEDILNNLSTTSSSESTYDGQTLSTTYTDDNGDTEESDTPLAIKVTFSKQTGEYSMETSQTRGNFMSYTNSYYKKNANGLYDYEGQFTRTTTRTSEEAETGYFTVTGGAGDAIEKNSQVVFQVRSIVTDFEDEFAYIDFNTKEDIIPSQFYWQVGSDFELLPVSESGTSSTMGITDEAVIWDVASLKKGLMDVSFEKDLETTNSLTSSTLIEKTEYSWELEKQ